MMAIARNEDGDIEAIDLKILPENHLALPVSVLGTISLIT